MAVVADSSFTGCGQVLAQGHDLIVLPAMEGVDIAAMPLGTRRPNVEWLPTPEGRSLISLPPRNSELASPEAPWTQSESDTAARFAEHAVDRRPMPWSLLIDIGWRCDHVGERIREFPDVPLSAAMTPDPVDSRNPAAAARHARATTQRPTG